MVGEIDKATEARRKAIRNGEEDPVVVAQRFLNIYRQRHIFNTERKEAFDKMLIELSPEVRGLFSSLPGGAMLQDYVDDLTKKNNEPTSEESQKKQSLNQDIESSDNETVRQAEIIANTLAKAQSQMPPVSTTVASTVSMDKDFAAEFSKMIENLLENQTSFQAKSLEKITADINKTQLFLAKNLKEAREEQAQDMNVLVKNIGDFYQRERIQQHKDIEEICKAIAQSQTALSLSMGDKTSQLNDTNIEKAEIKTTAGVEPDIAKKMMDMFLEGQKQLNSRIEKIEEYTTAKFNENKNLLNAFEQSQTALMQKIQETHLSGGVSKMINDRDDEKLIKILAESQENIVKTMLAANIQQNNNAQASTSANANTNNIQITAPDNSAQMLLLLDKISSMQSSGQKNLEKALVAAIKEQGEMYSKINADQTKELVSAIVSSLKNIQPTYLDDSFSKKREQEAVFESETAGKSFSCQVEEADGQETVQKVQTETSQEALDPEIKEIANEIMPKKKKKKKKKKKENINDRASNSEQDYFETHSKSSNSVHQNEESKDDKRILTTEKTKEYQEDQEMKFSKGEDDVNPDVIENTIFQPEKREVAFPKNDEFFSEKPEERVAEKASDWGFMPQDEREIEKQEKSAQEEWLPEDDIEAIGDNSYIGISDSYTQQVEPFEWRSIQPIEIKKTPILYDEQAEDEEDPYQNSMQKD